MSSKPARNTNPSHIETVDFSKHAKLKVKPNAAFPHGKDRNLVAINVSELGICSSTFPLVFIQNPADKRYLLMAMLGLKHGENVYYGEQFWESTYVPLAIQRHPFIVGFDDRVADVDQVATCLELDSPLVNESEGLPLFDADGKDSEFLRSRRQMLNSMFDGGKYTEAFIDRLVELDLIVSLDIVLQTQNGPPAKIAGLFTVDEAKLKTLSAEQLKDLQTRDYLAPCHLMLVSLYQLNQLIRRRNRQGGDEQITGFRIELGSDTKAASSS
ncbi:MAG: hypothetical protein RLZZ227_1759 [Pseudomonadota bacterium]|jgi:hypothetical protein